MSSHHDVRFSACCIRPKEGLNWSLGEFYAPDSADKNPRLAKEIADIAHAFESRAIFAPSVGAMSGKIVTRNELSISIPLNGESTMWRNKAVPSDGTWLNPGESWVMSGGGCPIIVAAARDECIVAHASRDSLLDRRMMLNGKPSRRYESVVNAIAESFERHDIPLHEVKLFVFFAIEQAAFGHSHEDPVHKVYNLRMTGYVLDHYPGAIMSEVDHGFLDCAKLIAIQARQVGIEQIVIDGMLEENSPFGHTRHANPKMRSVRNLVFVHRR